MASASEIRSGRAVVEIRAETGRLKADLAAGQQELNRFAQGGLGGGLDVAAGLKIGGVVLAARVGVDALRAAWGLVKGDVDAVRDAIGALPLGIGAVSVSLADLVSDVTGVTDEVKELADAWAISTKANTRFFAATLDLENITTDAHERARQAKLEGADLAIAKERLRVEKEREKVREDARHRGLGTNDPKVRAAVEALDLDLAAATDKITRKYAGEAAQADFSEMVRLADDATAEWLKGLQGVADFGIDKVVQAQAAAMEEFAEMVRLADDATAEWLKGIKESVDDAFAVAGEIEDLRARMAAGVAAADFTTSRGTFSAREAAGLSGGEAGWLRRAADTMSRDLKALLDVARKMGITYTS